MVTNFEHSILAKAGPCDLNGQRKENEYYIKMIEILILLEVSYLIWAFSQE